MMAPMAWWGLGAVVLLLLLAVARWRRGRTRREEADETLAAAAAAEGWSVPDDPAARDAIADAIRALGAADVPTVRTLAVAVRHSRAVACFAWGWRHRAGRRGAVATLPDVSLDRLARGLTGAALADDPPGRAAPARTEPADHLRAAGEPPFAAAGVELVVGALRSGDDGPHVPAALRVAGTARAPEAAARLVAALREAASALPPHGRLRLATGGTTVLLATTDGADVPWEVLMRTIERLVAAIEGQSSGMP